MKRPIKNPVQTNCHL